MRAFSLRRRITARQATVLPEPLSPDDAQHLAAIHGEGDAAQRRHRPMGRREFDLQILDREKDVVVHGWVCSSRASPSATSEKPRASTEMAMPGKTLIHQAVPR